MKKYLLTAGCGFALLVVSSCNKEEIGEHILPYLSCI